MTEREERSTLGRDIRSKERIMAAVHPHAQDTPDRLAAVGVDVAVVAVLVLGVAFVAAILILMFTL